MIERLAYFVATVGFVGRFPIAPGTAGTVAGLGVYTLVRLFRSEEVEAAAIVVTMVLGVWSAQIAERLLGGKDPGPVVIDEVLGMLVTVAFLDVNLLGGGVGFLLFRLFDVIKPYPAAQLERLPGGFGVMMDDLMAAIYAHAVMWVLVAAYPGWLV